MARRVHRLDPLSDVRKALRVLRALERALVAAERLEKRRGEKAAERFRGAQARLAGGGTLTYSDQP